jgi:tripartite-type tricarboxylate transporter receptor subunit TctC
MIKRSLVGLSFVLAAASSFAQQTISIAWPYAMSHGTTPLMYPLMQEANRLQSQYRFVIEAKPGASGLIAVNHMNQSPADRVAVIAPAFIDLAIQNKVNESDYDYMVGLGDMCFVLWNKYGNESKGLRSLQGTKEIVLGNVGWGNSGHLVALEIANRYDLKVRNIVFKSNQEGLINLAQDGGVTQVQEGPSAWAALKNQAAVQANPLAVTCNQRHRALPAVKTLQEQGIKADGPWIILVANREMPAQKREFISRILNLSLTNIGAERIMELANLHPVVFQEDSNVTAYYNRKSASQKALLKKYQSTIDADRGTTGK